MKIDLPMNVEEAFYKRLDRLAHLDRLYVSFSGGKDSLVLLHGVYVKIKEGVLDPKRVHVLFVDEEAVYPCIEQSCMRWRDRMLGVGAKFSWLCLEWMHYNCFDTLQEQESWLCWDRTQADRWVRPMPDFAIKTHPKMRLGMPYQKFLHDALCDGVNIIGLRMSESVQRNSFMTKTGVTNDAQKKAYPIYDFRDQDVWLYLKKHDIEIPECYLYMWKVGVPKNRLRVSQFFSVDTAHCLVRMMEFYPGLYERIIRRSPNARLAMYYFDSAMFGKHTRKRKRLEEGVEKESAKTRFFQTINDPTVKVPEKLMKSIRTIVLAKSALLIDRDYQMMIDAMTAGDPKGRKMRAIYASTKHISRT